MAVDIYNFRFRNNVVYKEYAGTAQILWPLVGKFYLFSFEKWKENIEIHI